MKGKIFLFAFIFLISMSFISFSSAQTQVASFSEQCATYASGAYIVMPTTIQEGKSNTAQNFYARVSDSNSKAILFGNLNMTFTIISPNSNRVLYYSSLNNMTNVTPYTAKVTVPASFFNETGDYSFHWHTSGSTKGGCFESEFPVTPNGTLLSTSTAILYGVVLLFLLSILMFSIKGATDGQDKSKEWVIGYMSVAYLMLFSLFYVIWSFATNYLYASPVIASISWIFWLLLGIGFIPYEAALVIYMVKNGFNEKKIQDFMGMGYSRSEALSMSKRK